MSDIISSRIDAIFPL